VTHADGFSRLVAVKLLKSQWSDSEEVARRMRDEARLLGLLRHRHIVNVMDLTAIDGRAAVVMEYLEAVDLRNVANRVRDVGGQLPIRAVVEIGAAVASALDAAYNRPPIPGDKPLRVIHRDIKPSNIMLDETGMVKVLDFGVARSEIENRESHTQELQFGSVDYMAPERLFFEPEAPSSDVYSLGASLFEMVALEKLGKARGRPAVHSANVKGRLDALMPRLAAAGPHTGAVRALIEDALAYNHESRPTAAEFYQRARTLARALDGEDLYAFSEREIPTWVKEAQAEPQSPGAFDDVVLTEDSSAFSGDVVADGLPVGDAAIGDELRRGALAELEETGAIVAVPPTGAPSMRSGGPRNVATLSHSGAGSPGSPGSAPLHAPDEGPTLVADASILDLPDSGATDDALAGVQSREADLPGDPERVPVSRPDMPDAQKEPFAAPLAPPEPAAARRRYALVVPERAPGEPPTLTGHTRPVTTATGAAVGAANRAVRPPRSPTLIPGDPADYEEGETATVVLIADSAGPRPVGPAAVAAIHAREEAATEPVQDEFGEEMLTEQLEAASRPNGPRPAAAPQGQPSADAVRTVQLARPMEHVPTQRLPRPVEQEVVRTEALSRPPVSEAVRTVQLARPVDGAATEGAPVAVAPVEATEDGHSESAAPATTVKLGEAAPPVAPKRKGLGLAAGLAAGCLFGIVMVVVLSVGLVLSLDHIRDFVAASKGGVALADVEPETAEVAEADAADDPSGDAEAAASGPALVFVSGAADTKKLKVRCDASKGQGTDRATVPVGSAASCTVTAYMTDRSRRTAAVQSPESGTYRCFAGADDSCRRE
jgi:tRNA A-37 threonylcarbamoyl transferase component Bud32